MITRKQKRILRAAGAALSTVVFIALVVFVSSSKRVEGRGIVLHAKGVFPVQAPVKGTVARFFVKRGERVEAGQPIARLVDVEQELSWHSAKRNREKLLEELKSLQKEVEREAAAYGEATKRELAAKEFAREQLKSEIDELKKAVDKKRKLLNEGLISLNILESGQEKLAVKKVELEGVEARITSLFADRAKGYRTEEVKQKERYLMEATDKLEMQEAKMGAMQVSSPHAGIVYDLFVGEGAAVKTGDALASVEHLLEDAGSSAEILGYLSVSKASGLAIGDQVEVELSTARGGDAGYFIGTVADVSDRVMSKKKIAGRIQDEELARYLTDGEEVAIEVVIRPASDASVKHWKSGTVLIFRNRRTF